MEINRLLGLLLILIFSIIVVWSYTCIPLSKINKSLAKVIKNLEKELREGKKFENKEKLFSEKKLQYAWDRYYKKINISKDDIRFVDINCYFNPDKFLNDNINKDLSGIMPMLLFFLTIIIMFAFTFFYQVDIQSEAEDLLLIISGSTLACILILISYKLLLHKSKLKLIKFVDLWSGVMNSPAGVSEQLNSIRYLLEDYNSKQQRLFGKLDENASNAVISRIDPFHSSIQAIIKDHLSAISTDQQVAMQNLADYFVKNTAKLYDGQINKISEMTMKMTMIQEKTSGSFENITEFFEKSRDAVSMSLKNSAEMTDSYQKYLAQMKDVSMGIDAGITLMGKMLIYIDENNKNKNFTIEKLSEYQNELVRVSEQSNKQINEFFNDFKDHYSSYIVAMNSVSDDMIKSGQFVKESFSNATNELNREVSNVYLQFEENISDISIRLAKSINELQEAIDELPVILKNIK